MSERPTARESERPTGGTSERSTDATFDRQTDADGPSPIATLRTLRGVPGFVVKTVERLVVTRRLARRFRDHPDHRSVNPEAATAAVEDADQILFLCWGNICRSPLAARYLRSRLESAGIDGVTVESAGLGETEGRASPDAAVKAAGSIGVDLSGHRSARTAPAQVEASDAIFVMDHYNYYLLVTRFPEAAGRTFYLGALAQKAESTTIPDPHGEGRRAFDAAYGTIVEAIDRLVESLSPRRGRGRCGR